MKDEKCFSLKGIVLRMFVLVIVMSSPFLWAQSETSSTSSEPDLPIQYRFSSAPSATSEVAPRVQNQAGAAHPMLSGSIAPADPEIIELARALKNDPDLIYQYVHDNIEFSPSWGTLKGPVGTLLDGRGNSFDQSALLVALLRQASSANPAISDVVFEYGQLNLSSVDLQKWLGVDSDPQSASSVISVGGIPCGSCSGGGAQGLSHVWVKVSINGTAYVFDPAFKEHNWKSELPDLASIMGYSKSQFMNDAAATVTSNSIQGVNRTQLRNDLAGYTANLANYMRNHPQLRMSDIVGGGAIIATTPTSGQVVHQSVLPYQSGIPTDWPSIPDGSNNSANYHGKLSITLPGQTAPQITYNSDDIYGHRLSIFFDGNYIPRLYRDGHEEASGSAASPGSSVGIAFSILIPNNSSGIIINHTQKIKAVRMQDGGGYIVGTGWDQVGRGMIEKHQRLLDQALASGATATTQPELVLGESLSVEGYTWLAEFAAQQQLSDQLLGTTTHYPFGGGIVGESTSGSIISPYVDLPLNYIIPSARINGAQSTSQLASIVTSLYAGSSFESASLEQTQSQVPGFVAASTVKLLDLAMQNGDPIYDISSTNWNSVSQSLSANYFPSDYADLNRYVSNGYRVIAPLHGKIPVGQWIGAGYMIMSQSGTSFQSGISFSVGAEISNGLSGGHGGTNASGTAVSNSINTGNQNQSSNLGVGTIYSTSGSSQTVGDPLDRQKGTYQYQHADLSIGTKGFPYGLTFERSYDSGAQSISRALGVGWTHNFDITAKVASDGFAGLGQAAPLSVAGSIASLFVSADLAQGQNLQGQQNLEVFALEAVVNRWFTDQLTNNVVSVSQRWNTEEFTKMPDGSYAPPIGSSTILDVSGGGFRYRTKAGDTMNFDSSGQISSWSNAAGASATFAYNGTLLSSVTSATGRQLSLNYNGNKITSVSDGSRTVGYSYTNGNLTGFTDALSQSTSFAYDTSGTYDTAGHLTQVFYPSNPGNAFVTNYYDGFGKVMQQKDAIGNLTQAFFAGTRSEIDDPSGNRNVWYLDSLGNVLGDIQDYGPAPHLNITTMNIYDAQSNLIDTIMPEGNYVTYSYDAYFNPLTITQTPKSGSPLSPRVQSFTYTRPVSSLPNFEEAASSTDPNGNVTTFTYNSESGTLWKVDQPAVLRAGSGTVTPEQVFTYTSIGLPQTSQDAEGRVTRFDYDSSHADQVITTTADYGRLNLATQYGYDAYGDVNSVTDANGHTTTSQYDALRRVSEVDAAISGLVTKYTYYPDGQVCSVSRQVATGNAAPACNGTTTSSWETTQYTYSLSDKVTVVTDSLGNTTTTTYDADDRVQTATQQVTATQNRQRTYSYDALSRLIQLNDTTGGSPGTVLETHAYTPNGNALTFADANGNTTSYAYDGFDRLDHTTYPDTHTESYQYDANGNALQKTTRSGQIIGFSYDALNRVRTKAPQGEAAGQVSYGYDLTGRLLQASDGSSGTPYAVGYDTAGRANSYTDQQNRNTQVQYDGVGNRTRLQWPAGTNGAGAYFVTYHYDEMNRMSEIDENGSSSSPLAKYVWDSLSRQAQITHGDGSTDISQYDAGDNLLALTQNYAGANNSVTFSYGWQMNHQRASTSVNDGAFQYVPSTGTTGYAAADANNGYTSLNSSSGGTTFTYDNNRNLSFDGFNTLTYDVENRLVQAQNLMHGTSQYLYDPMGNRKQKQVGADVTQFVLAGGEEIADLSSAGWTLTVRGAGGLPVAAISPAAGGQAEYAVYYHHDVMGSTVAATAAGDTPEVYTYGEFGAPGAGGSLQYTYAGYRYDSETGLYYVHARYYNPNLGRFLQTDPIGFQGGNNLYAYVGNDPVNLFDPMGLNPQNRVGGDEMALNSTNGSSGNGRLACTGTAYVLAGNPSDVGQQGFPGVTVTNDSAAVIPRQFTGQLTGGPVMRSIGSSTFGTVTGVNGATESFNGLTQSIGMASMGSAQQVQNIIMARAPGQLILEIVGGQDLGKGASVTINMPNLGQGCPTGTSPVPLPRP